MEEITAHTNTYIDTEYRQDQKNTQIYRYIMVTLAK